MDLLLIIIISISLSMDAFSLSLAYGTLGISKKQIYLLSIIVGIFHFFMPLFGLFIGNGIFDFLNVNSDFIVCLILSVIGIQMIFESLKKQKEIKLLKPFEFFLFAFTVSIDSFSVGLTLTNITKNYLLSCLFFSLSSFLFTSSGLLLGNKIKKSIGQISTLFGGIILIIVGVIFVI